MVKFITIIKKFAEKGEKTGWTYIDIFSEIAEQLNPGVKKAYRVKGKLDKFSFEGISLTPIGGGDFIMSLNGNIRKGIKKSSGDKINVEMQVDTKERKLSSDFIACLEDEPKALNFFQTLPKSHQKYFSNWIESAKTDTTKTKRIAQAVNALAMKLSFGEMIRMNKKNRME